MTSLRERLRGKRLLHVVSAHSPLSALLAEEAGLNVIWGRAR